MPTILVIANPSDPATTISPSPQLSYIIGAILGDGNIYKTKANAKHGSAYGICLRVKDRDFVEKVNEAVCSVKNRVISYPIKECLNSKTAFGKGTHFRLDFYSQPIYKILQSKSIALEIAEIFPADFIRGFADAEGSVHHGKRKNRNYPERFIQIANTNTTLLKFIQRQLEKLSIKSDIHYGGFGRFGTLPRYNLVIGRNESIVHYQQKIGFSIKRKLNKLNQAISTIRHYRYVMPSKEELEQLHEKRLTQQEIAKIYNVTQSAVSFWLRQIGIMRGRGWKP